MYKPALFLTAFLVLILFQQNSYGFMEGGEVSTFPDFLVEGKSDIVLLDLPKQENKTQRYLVYGSGSLNNVYHDPKDLVYGIDSGERFFSVGILTENDALQLKSDGYHVIEDFLLDFHSKYVSTNAICLEL